MSTTKPEPIDTTALREIAEAATPGPWHAERIRHRPAPGKQHDCWEITNDDGYTPFIECIREDELDARETAAHIAAFHPGTALALLDEVEALRAQVERVREVHRATDLLGRGECCSHCTILVDDGSGDCWMRYPCPTIRALDGEVKA